MESLLSINTLLNFWRGTIQEHRITSPERHLLDCVGKTYQQIDLHPHAV